MAGKEVWFRASDGREISCNEGSVAFGLMSKDGAFTRIGDDGEAIAPATDAELDLSKLKRAELLEYAAGKGIEVNPKLKNADIIAVIEAAQAATAAETTEDE